ncbi:aldehyde dehydrogenase family protein [Paraburkholderia jirisanensis]
MQRGSPIGALHRLASRRLWSAGIERVQRESHALKSGAVWINTNGYTDVRLPWGGVGDWGFGREHIAAAIANSRRRQSGLRSITDGLALHATTRRAAAPGLRASPRRHARMLQAACSAIRSRIFTSASTTSMVGVGSPTRRPIS